MPDDEPLIRARQRSRSIVLAVLLGVFVVLMFGISIAKIKAGHRAPGAGANTSAGVAQ